MTNKNMEEEKSDKQKLKEAIERIGDLDQRLSDLEESFGGHQHDSDGFTSHNY